MTEKQDNFRAAVTEGGGRGLAVVKSFLGGVPIDALRAKIAMQMVREGLKVEHINQIQDQNQVSNAIRIANLLRDPEERARYVAATAPKGQPKLAEFAEKAKKQLQAPNR